jgi:hypothetical protein
VAITFTSPLSVPVPQGGFFDWQIVTLALSGPNVPAWNALNFNYGGSVVLVNQIQTSTNPGIGGALVESNFPVQIGTTAPAPIFELSATYYLIGGSSMGSLTVDRFSLTVQVATTAPEPATWTMLLIGFAGVGFAAYRRRSRTRSIRPCLIENVRLGTGVQFPGPGITSRQDGGAARALIPAVLPCGFLASPTNFAIVAAATQDSEFLAHLGS